MDINKLRQDITSLPIGDHGQPKKGESSCVRNCFGYSVTPCKTSISFLWKKKSSLLLDTDGKMLRSRQALPETVRGINALENLSNWKKVNPDCVVNLWIDGNDTDLEDIEITKARLTDLDIMVSDFRDCGIFKKTLLSRYLEGNDFSESENVFDHLIQCRMDWEVIDLLKIVTALHTLSCGEGEISIFSDLDVKPFSIHETLSKKAYAQNPMDLLEAHGFLVASSLIKSGKVVPANNFFIFSVAGVQKLTRWFENAIRLALEGNGNAFRCMEDSLSCLQNNLPNYSASDQRVISRVPLINIGELQGQKK